MLPVVELDSNGNVRVDISAGKAYIRGYKVEKDSMSDVRLNRATTTRFVQSESHFYNENVSNYMVSHTPVASVSNLTVLYTVKRKQISRSSPRGSTDSLLAVSEFPIDHIVEVWTENANGEPLKVYNQGVDYTLYNNAVDWSKSGTGTDEPDPGTSYYVTFVQNRSLVYGQDYRITMDGDYSYITFLDGGAKPDHNTRMYISYYYTLSRRDLILLDSKGVVSVIEGKPDEYNKLLTPYNGSSSYLELGYVNIFAKPTYGEDDPNHIAEVVNLSDIRLTQEVRSRR